MKRVEAANAGASHDEAATEDELVALETGTLNTARFPHSEHVRLGYEMLARYSFGEAVTKFSRGLKLVAARAGQPEKYHETITIAFLALIGERRVCGDYRDWSGFKASNSDLLEKGCLEKWYDGEQLGSDLARRTFCLPRPRVKFPRSGGL